MITKKEINFLKEKYTKLYNIFSLNYELQNGKKDKHGRILYNSLDLDISNPKISKILKENGFLNIKYSHGKKACVLLTHDIDAIKHSFKGIFYYGLKDIINLSFIRFFKRVIGFLNKKNDLWRNFDKIINIEKKYNAKSIFFFMSTNDSDKRYNIKKLKKDLKNIIKQGYEVGLHGGYDKSSFDYKILKEEKESLDLTLGKKSIGIRQHYLRFYHKKTFEIQKKSGFKYDTTLGFAEQIGFRNLVCHAFNPIDLNTGEIQEDFWEIPMIIMDGTLWGYMNLSFDEAWINVKNVLDKVIKLNGCVSILWHNNQFDDSYQKGSQQMYEKILDYLNKNNVWMPTGEELINFLENNK